MTSDYSGRVVESDPMAEKRNHVVKSGRTFVEIRRLNRIGLVYSSPQEYWKVDQSLPDLFLAPSARSFVNVLELPQTVLEGFASGPSTLQNQYL